MMAMSGSVDSFKFLLDYIEKDIIGTISDVHGFFAVVGTFYSIRKVISVASRILSAANEHLLSRFEEEPEVWKRKFGPWAVVTGSSEGIGRAYAFELAKRGLNIVLLSRNERKLIAAKEFIESNSDARVEYIIADFASENQTELYAHIEAQLAGKEVGLLVNNVGVMYDYPDVLLNVPRQKLWQLVNVNILAATTMSHLLLPHMVGRGRGGLVVVSSGSSTQITPQMTVYSATKRYLDYFIQGLAYEYRNSGVTFQCLIPFYVATRMTGYSDSLSKTSLVIPDACRYASHAVITLGHSARTTGYFPHTVQLWIAHCIPLWMWMWGSDKLNNSLRQQALRRQARRAGKQSSREKVSPDGDK